jgi:hypothetical protein
MLLLLPLLLTAADGPPFVVHTTAPDPVVRPLAALPGVDELVSVRRADRAIPGYPRGPQLILANGDRVRGTVDGGDRQSLQLHFAATDTKWKVPLSAVAAVWVAGPPADSPTDPGRYPWVEPGKRRDAVLLVTGDVVRGTVDSFAASPPAVRVKTATELTILPLDRVAAIAFDPTLARLRKPAGPYHRLVAADGSRLCLTGVGSNGRTLTGTTLFNAKVGLPVDEVIALDVLGGKATYLSDLKPVAERVEGYGGLTWPWAADRTVKGQPLRLAGRFGVDTFDKGLGTHPRTTLTYALDGKFKRFEAVVGLDPATGRRGVVDVRVRVDDKEVTPAGLIGLTAAARGRPVRVDLTGAKRLTLVVDFGPAGDVQADVNWADARVVE